MIKSIEKILVKLPLNGDLTTISTAMVAISTQSELLAIPQLATPLAVIGITGSILGLFRKLIKRISGASK